MSQPENASRDAPMIKDPRDSALCMRNVRYDPLRFPARRAGGLSVPPHADPGNERSPGSRTGDIQIRNGEIRMERDTTQAKVLLSVAAVCAMLVGCAAQPISIERVNCNVGSCDADVHVEVKFGTCTVSAPDIDNYGSNNIFWNIDQASKDLGYRYPDEAVQLGIYLKSPAPIGCQNPSGVFDSPQRQTDWKFKLHDKGNRGTYCYGVYVVRDTPPSPCVYDPQIVNH